MEEVNELVKKLACREAHKLTIAESIENIHHHIPFFKIEGEQVLVGGFKHHDNASRMIFWAKYLQTHILPFMPKNGALNGYYNIELHDSYSHIPRIVDAREKNDTGPIDEYKNCLVWSRHKHDNDVVLLPDLYHIINYNNRLENNPDHYVWEQKNDKIGFWGTTTGHMDPCRNNRIQTCLWFDTQDPSHKLSDCYITNIAQMTYADIIERVPTFQRIKKNPVILPFQYNYKFLLDIPGNTCSWDRVPHIMHSRSLLLKMPCEDMCFYYPLLKDGETHVEVDKDSVFKKREYYLQNPREAKHITQKANAFSENVFKGDVARSYIRTLFEEVAYLKGK